MQIKLAYALTLITGFTGLVYQVTWQKYLAFYLGSHALATSIVLAVFFLFLSIGYATIGQNAHRIPIKNKLFLYGVVEALIGFYVLLSPNLFHILTDSVPVFSGSVEKDILYGFLFSSLFIGFPTLLMGATIPVLTLAMSQSFEKSHHAHATVYGLNTLGAVFGAVLAGFVFIEAWGLPKTLLLTSLVNISVGLITWLAAKSSPNSFSGINTVDNEQETQDGRKAWTALLLGISFLSGFYVFSLQNLIIRVTAFSIGSNNYTYSIIVSAFILGIAAGSLLIRNRNPEKNLFLIWVQGALALSLVALYVSIPMWPELFGRIKALFLPSLINVNAYWTVTTGFFLIILFIPTALMGMNLPLLFNYIKSRQYAPSKTVGRLYSLNTLGSVIGSVLGGYYMLNHFDWDAAFKINIVLIALTIPLIAFLSATSKSIKASALTCTVVAVITIAMLPHWSIDNFIPRPSNSLPQNSTESYGDFITQRQSSISVQHSFYGPSTHAAVAHTSDKIPSLYINANPNTGKGDYGVRALNAIYPLSLVKDPESAFIVGLGGGLSASLLAEVESIQSVTVSEISKSVVAALPHFDSENNNFTQESIYSKVDIQAIDAIKLLSSQEEKYDIIVSEPNHPWVSGVENLFSTEFLTTVKNKLTSKGVYCQWFPLFGTDHETTLLMLNTMRDVFSHVYVFSSTPSTLSIVASNSPIEVDHPQLVSINEQFRDRIAERLPYFKDPYFILGTQMLNSGGLSAITSGFVGTQSLEYPKISYRAFRSRFAGINTSMSDNILPLTHGHAQPPVFLYHQLKDAAQLPETFFLEMAKTLRLHPDGEAYLPRFWVEHQQHSTVPWPEQILSSDKQQMYSYLSNASQQPSNATYKQLYIAYRELLIAQVHTDASKLLDKVPPRCNGDPECLFVKRGMAEALLPSQRQAISNLKLSNAETIEQLYQHATQQIL